MEEKDRELRDALLANQSTIEALQRNISRIAETEKAKTIADGQVAALKSQNASQVVDLEEKLAKERRFREQLKTHLTTLLASINECLTSEELKTLTDDFDGSSLAVGKAEFETVKKLVNELATDVETISTQLKTKVSEANAKITAQLRVWMTKEKETQATIEDLRRELEKKNIKLDIAFIRKVTKDATEFATKLVELKQSVPKQREEFKRRRELMKERRELKSKMFTIRQAFATVMNKNLACTVADYRVTIRFHEGVLSSELEELIKAEMEWRTSRVPKASLIASHLSPFMLLEAIDRKDTSKLEEILDDANTQVFSRNEAVGILTRLGVWKAKTVVERCASRTGPKSRSVRRC